MISAPQVPSTQCVLFAAPGCNLPDAAMCCASACVTCDKRWQQEYTTSEQYKAWSQNLGHEDVLTTFRSYGDVSSYRQAEIMRSFAYNPVRLSQKRCGGEALKR
jgi:hypothetical protein